MTRPRLPPLSRLRAFEAAARHRSFKRAAEELSVTPAAISQQVRQLEESLGLPLFERQARQVVPTRAAQALYPVLRDGFDAFADALAALTHGNATVVLTTTPAFAMQRLLPCLDEFQLAHPDVELRLHASNATVDLDTGDADLAIRYGNGPYPQHRSLLLEADRLLPVASPRLALHRRSDLGHHRLIHFDWHRQDIALPGWPQWLQQARLTHADAARGLHFSEESHAIQAAIAGQGVALLSRALVEHELRRGVLVAPFGPELAAPGWHLLQPTAQARREAVDRVWRWLVAAFPPQDERDATNPHPKHG